MILEAIRAKIISFPVITLERGIGTGGNIVVMIW
jgi:hypothetical protein